MSELQATWIEGEAWPDEDAEWVDWISGGINPPPTRERYLAKLDAGQHEVFHALERGVHAQGLLGMTGEHADTRGHWRLSDGRCFGCSWRAWADIMGIIVGKGEGYIPYYCGEWISPADRERIEARKRAGYKPVTLWDLLPKSTGFAGEALAMEPRATEAMRAHRGLRGVLGWTDMRALKNRPMPAGALKAEMDRALANFKRRIYANMTSTWGRLLPEIERWIGHNPLRIGDEVWPWPTPLGMPAAKLGDFTR
jgi:hypothetical protein